jgi:hypothetical protein
MDEQHTLREARTMTSLRIENTNDFEIKDMFDGVPYELKPNEPISMPSDAAFHIFGWRPGVDMMVVKNHTQKRWGWNTPDLVKDKSHDRYFANLKFKPITYRIVEVPEEVTELKDDELPKLPTKNGKTTGVEAPA